ncbi:TPA: SA0632 family lipoprotein, partial [Staphylococcus aureus]
ASQDKQSKDQTKSSDKDNHKKPTSADKDQKANDKHQS